MIRLAVLLALSASAAEYDFRNPSFWLKIYDIPETYCVKGIAVEVKDFSKVAPIFKACGSQHPNGEKQWITNCDLPLHEASEIVGRLRGAGRLLSYTQECGEPKDLAELDYKLSNLTREAGELKLSSETYPGISGLLAAQLAHIEWLIRRRTRAEVATVTLTAALSPAPPGLQATHFWRTPHRESAPPVNYPWSRTPRSVCQQIEYIDSGFAISAATDDMRKFGELVDKIGTDIPSSTCGEVPRGRPWRFIFSKAPRAKVLPRMLEIPSLVSWRLITPARLMESLSDDKKYAILSREETEVRPMLERAPHIKSLLQSETERLEPNARSLNDYKGGTLILFRTNGQ